MDHPPKVLIVDDNKKLANIYGVWLSDDYPVEIVYSGEEALDCLDETFDIVLLDRRMPGMSGEDVLTSIRADELDCRVALVTTVEPDFDILGLGFDAYLVKEVTRDSLQQLVKSLSDLIEYDEQFQEYYSLCSKQAVLQSHKETTELQNNSEFVRLEERISEIEEELDGLMNDFSETEFRAIFQRVE